VSHVVAALLKFDVDAAKREETEAAGNALAAAGAGPGEVIPPPRSGADVEAERRRRRKAMGRAIQSFADELNPVWAALSEACTVLEPQIAAAAAVAAASSRGGTAAPALPAGARQIQPVVEAYFALASAINDASKRVAPEASVEEPGGRNATVSSPERGGVMGSDEGLVSSNAAPSGLDADDRAAFGLSRVTSPAFGLARSATPANGAATAGGRAPHSSGPSASHPGGADLAPVAEEEADAGADKDGPGGVTSVWNFTNEHRSVVNALVRSQPGLLDGSLRLMLEKPRLLDFDNKRSYIRGKLKRLAEREQMRGSHHGPVRAQINRKQVLTDSFMQLQHLKPAELRGRLTIQFSGEEGIDAGGVSREWYMLLARDMFNPDKALFELSPSGDGAYQPFGNSGINETHLAYFKFIGRIIGKAVYDGYLVDAHFTRPFYKHMLNIPLNYDDMEAFDPDYHKSLVYMLEHPLEESGLDYLTMSATADYFGMETVVDLIPDGRDVSVTDDNKLEYVNLVAAHRMTNAIKEQIAAFTEGFNDIVPHEIISILNPSELELLISGTPEIDIDDLKNNTEYTGYTTSAPQVRWFWEVVKDLSEEDRARLLMFVTGTSKVPLDGFKALQGISGPQRFQIHKAYGGGQRLCSAHTCFNQLDLPEYNTKEELKDRLLFAIREGSEGFGFG
jgi:E3 ubiquitin-protein ligase HUWE1